MGAEGAKKLAAGLETNRTLSYLTLFGADFLRILVSDPMVMWS